MKATRVAIDPIAPLILSSGPKPEVAEYIRKSCLKSKAIWDVPRF